MSSPITALPIIPGAIERPRLMQQMQQVITHRLTLVSAPPGYGKTTVTSQLAHNISNPVAWHSIDRRQRDLPSLVAASIKSLEAVAPGISRHLPNNEGLSPAERATLIAEYLEGAINGTALYILDDIHHLDGASRAETWLRTLIERIPRTCKLILISRTVPRLPYADLISRSEILPLGQDEIRLTRTEIGELAKQIADTPLSNDQIEELWDRLEGWPAGTMLALQPLPEGLAPDMLRRDGGPEALFESLAESMLQSQPADLRQFLLDSSTLAQMTPERCTHAISIKGSINWLETVLTRNLFASRSGGNVHYHALFREFLQSQQRVNNPQRFVNLHAQAAQWFKEKDNIDRAFDHYLEAGLLVEAVELVDSVAGSFHARGSVETILRWNDDLACRDTLAPRLALECARIHTDRYHYEDAERELDRAAADQTDTEAQARITLQRAMINMQRGKYHECIERAKVLIDHPSPDIRGGALRWVGISNFHLGYISDSLTFLEQAAVIYRNAAQHGLLSQLLQDLQLAYTKLGRLDDAAACLQEVVALSRRLGGKGPLGLALNNLGYHYHLRGDYKQALQTFQEGLSIVAHTGDTRVESALLWSQGDVLRDLDLVDGDESDFATALSLLPDGVDPGLRSAILISAATLRRWQGKCEDAILLSDEALRIAQQHNLRSTIAVACVAHWAAQAQLGWEQQALDEISEAASILRDIEAPTELMTALAIWSSIACSTGDEQAARDAFIEAIDISNQLKTAQPLAAEIVHNSDLELLQELMKPTDILHEDLRRLDDARRTFSSQDTAYGSILSTEPYSLTVYTLGNERIDRDGISVPSSEWRAATARELFFYLLFLGPHSRESIGLIFWPDNSADSVRNNFHTTLHRARQALGKEVVSYANDLYGIRGSLDVWCDALEMDHLAEQARLLPSHEARAEDLWRKVAQLYQGEFLPTLDSDWIIQRREYYAELHVEALLGLGRCGISRGDARSAIHRFQAAIAIDPYRENAHRGLMRCYAKLGQNAQIAHQFDSLSRLLKDDLGIIPAPETRHLAQRLLSLSD